MIPKLDYLLRAGAGVVTTVVTRRLLEDLIDDPTENSRDEGSSVTVDETLGVDQHDQSSVPNLAGQTEETNATNNSREEVDDYFFLDTRNEVLVESDFDSGIEYEIGELLGQDEDYF